VAMHVFSLSGRGQNRLSRSHSAQATVERTVVANSPSSPGTGHSGPSLPSLYYGERAGLALSLFPSSSPTPKPQNPSRCPLEEAKGRSKDDIALPDRAAATSSTPTSKSTDNIEHGGSSGGLSLYPDSERPGLNNDHQPGAWGSLLLYPDPMSMVAADPPISRAFLQGSWSPA
jgi:hypothetical protein